MKTIIVNDISFSNRKHWEQGHAKGIHILRLGLGNVRAVSASTIFGKLRMSLEGLGCLWESLDVFVSSLKSQYSQAKYLRSITLKKLASILLRC